MSSSEPFMVSSPPTPLHGQHKSKYTFKQLSQLSSYHVSTPLRVVGHIDLDAFYAQCEMVRLGVSPDQPLAVQQWQGLIAINYPARAYGLNRHVTVAEAQKACPDIVVQHVATWKEGEARWAYHDDAYKHIGTHKVSLDPYRLESRKIIAAIKECLPADLQKVEKASVDEVFVDLSAQVHHTLLERFPNLNGPPPYDDPTEALPAPPTTALDWNVDALVDLNESQHEEEAPDWDDIVLLIGSEIIRGVRAHIKDKLKYTCSAGIAKNKMLAKLGSGHKKPNSQTVIRNRAVNRFLNDFKLTNLRNLGGKLGEEIVNTFDTESLHELLDYGLEVFKKKLGDDTGSWLHQMIRGEDFSEVNSRTAIKSMLSAKSFRPHINSFEQAVRWLRIFVADIYLRLVEEGVQENKRRPRTINLHHRQGQQTRSKQAPIPQGRVIDEEMLFQLVKNLMAQVVVDGRAWPCSNLSLSVGGFEDGVSNNKGIGGFLIKGDEARAMHDGFSRPGTDSPDPESFRAAKRRRTDSPKINAFFTRHENNNDQGFTEFDEVPSAQIPNERHNDKNNDLEGFCLGGDFEDEHDSKRPDPGAVPTLSASEVPTSLKHTEAQSRQSNIEGYFCETCKRHFSVDDAEEHRDWHFARTLQQEEQVRDVPREQNQVDSHKRSGTHDARGANRGKTKSQTRSKNSQPIEKGQSRLAFGN